MQNKHSHSSSIMRQIKRQLRNPRKRLLVEAIAAIAVISLIISLIVSDKKTPSKDLKDGVAYIKSLEKKDFSKTEETIKEIKRKERKEALESGEQDVWKYFNDSVVLGDSRAVGFEYHGFIPEDRVFAEGGATIRNIPDYIDGIKKVNPSSIILCFGLNDISIGYWKTSEEYIEELDKMLALLHEELPDATVFVNSTIPAIDPAFEKSEKWRDIPDWNKDVKAHCKEEKIPYIDISDLMKEHKNLYDTDGIHVKKEFYPYWAIAIITEVTENE
nr:GDSL-type esterase/lipase family protein [uncultured Blautia sp.]